MACATLFFFMYYSLHGFSLIQVFVLSLRPSICRRLFCIIHLKIATKTALLSCSVGLCQQTVSVLPFDLLCFNSNSSAARPWRSWACLITTCPTYQPPLPAWLTSKSWTSVKTVWAAAPLHVWCQQIWEQHKSANLKALLLMFASFSESYWIRYSIKWLSYLSLQVSRSFQTI